MGDPNRERSRPDRVRVLHVDGDPGAADTTAAFLEREERIEVVTETDASDGLGRLASEDVDCVVAGYDMPGTDGIEFLEAIREERPDLPFVLFAGEGSEGVASDAIAAGATDYLRKGSGTGQYDLLCTRILNAVTHHRAERERRIEALHAATRRLTSAETEGEVAELATEAAETTLDFPMTAVRLLDGDLLVPVALSDGMRSEAGDERPAYEVGEPTAGLAFERGETVVYGDLADHEFGHDFEHTPGASMYVPIGDYGVLTVSDTEPDAFDRSDVDLAEILAAHAEVALDRVERTRKLRQRNERLDQFASVVAHDLRNPLNVLSGSLDLAEETGDPEHFRRCGAAVDRMERLIEDLLAVSRQGGAVDDPDPVRLASVVEGCWETVGTDGATLDLDADLTVRADTNRLKQLLENLLGNAVDHAGPEVTVTVGELEDGRGFYVADDGPGIPEGERDRAFESGYSTAADGTGFGLAIVERIAEAHGWEVRVTEGRPGGARFEIAGVSVEPDAECAP